LLFLAAVDVEDLCVFFFVVFFVFGVVASCFFCGFSLVVVSLCVALSPRGLAAPRPRLLSRCGGFGRASASEASRAAASESARYSLRFASMAYR